MLIKKSFPFFLLILALVSCKSLTNKNQNSSKDQDITSLHVKQPVSYVNDYSNLLSEQEIVELDKFLRQYEKETTRECLLVIMKNIEPYEDILEFGKDIGNRLGVGKKEKNNGLMMILDMSKRNIAISTGLGTEKVLTDSVCQKVIDTDIIPKFKEDQFYEGIVSGFKSLMDKWE